MNFFLHGDHQLKSRELLNQLITEAKAKDQEIVRLDGKKISLTDFIQAISSQSLFGTDRCIVIENLFSRLKSQEQASLLSQLKNYQGDLSLIFWEEKSIGKILQRQLPAATTIKEFKTPVLVFKLVEQLAPQTKPQALQTMKEAMYTEAAEFMFAMIARQFRMMLTVAGGESISGAPWMIGKLKKQAASYDFDTLKKRYFQLYRIDKSIKTGQALMPLSWYLEMFVLGL